MTIKYHNQRRNQYTIVDILHWRRYGDKPYDIFEIERSERLEKASAWPDI